MREYLCVCACAALGGGFSLCSEGIKTTALNREIPCFLKVTLSEVDTEVFL